MTGHRRNPWVVALGAARLAPGTGPAGAHESPTLIERATPAAVHVEARAEIEVFLVEHRKAAPAGPPNAIVQSTLAPHRRSFRRCGGATACR